MNPFPPGDLRKLSEKELIEKYCADPPDTLAGEELASRYLPKVKTLIENLVHRKNFCPKGYSQDLFADEAEGRAIDKILKGLCRSNIRNWGGWLAHTTRCAVVEIYREYTGSRRETRNPKPVPEVDETGRNVFADLPDTKAAAARQKKERQIEQREFIEKVLLPLLLEHGLSSKRRYKCVIAMRLRFIDDAETADIAEKIRMTRGSLDHLYTEDYEEIRRRYHQKYGKTDLPEGLL